MKPFMPGVEKLIRHRDDEMKREANNIREDAGAKIVKYLSGLAPHLISKYMIIHMFGSSTT